jgi:outer membrane receptor protein involved in Fe transport
MRMRNIGFLFAFLLMSAGLFAQGVQTGTIRGTVKDQQDLAVPGVTVTVSSPALQGVRNVTTDAQGGYVFRNLPPGDYEVKFELSGFGTVTQKTAVPLGLTVEQNVTMRPSGVAETVNVVAETPGPIATPIVGANFKHDEIESLANRRTLEGVAQLSPALTENSPNVTQVVINGAFAFDNSFLINGVDVNDNLTGQPQNLFIEDAIEETQILTSGISAEFGRFTGGVINAITKSGGNTFSGSARMNLTNPSWITATPFEVSKGPTTVDQAHPDTLFKTYEGTFGGPIVKDRLWYFLSGRYSSTSAPTILPVTGAVLTQPDTNKRGEVKLTATLSQNQTIQGGFLNNPRTLSNNSGIQSLIIDPKSESDLNQPNSYFFANYKGVLKNNLFVEAQYSQRHFAFNQTGPSGSNILDSPFFNTANSQIYNAPYFDATDPESRNNKQITGSTTSYWAKAGRHETKGGYEWFRSQRTGGNSQSPTDYVFSSDYVLDANGSPSPVFVPGVSFVDYYPAIKGAELNVDSNSLYVQDHWTINGRWSADLGARFEHVTATSTGGIVSIDNNRIVPRLAIGYDIKGNGDHTVHASYGQYSGRYNESQIGQNSPVGNPPDITSVYQGPAGQGYNFAPGTNVANYPISSANSSVLDPTKNVFMAPGTKSPLTHEFTLSYGANLLKGRGYADVSYVARVTHDLIEDFQTLQGGFTNVVVSGVPAGQFTNVIYQNTDLANRQYQAMVFQARYRIARNWNINGHYTLQLKNYGNYEGEGTNQPGKVSLIGNYPEAFNAARNFPEGNLQDFQRSRLRIWSVKQWTMSRAGDLSVSGLWRVDSGRAYSLAARNQPLTATQDAIIANAGYPDTPQLQTVYFGDRGSQFFPGFAVFDASVNYNVPVFRKLRPYVKFDIYNLFNNEKLIAYSTTVSQNKAAGVDNLGLATSYTPSSTFGTGTGNTQTNLNESNINTYPLAYNGATPGGRTFQMAVGFRF